MSASSFLRSPRPWQGERRRMGRAAKHRIPRTHENPRPADASPGAMVSDNGRPRRYDPSKRAHGERLTLTADRHNGRPSQRHARLPQSGGVCPARDLPSGRSGPPTAPQSGRLEMLPSDMQRRELGTAYRILSATAHTAQCGRGGTPRPPWDTWDGRDKGSDKGSDEGCSAPAHTGGVPLSRGDGGGSAHPKPQVAVSLTLRI